MLRTHSDSSYIVGGISAFFQKCTDSPQLYNCHNKIEIFIFPNTKSPEQNHIFEFQEIFGYIFTRNDWLHSKMENYIFVKFGSEYIIDY